MTSDLWCFIKTTSKPPSTDRSQRIDLSQCSRCSLIPAVWLLHVYKVSPVKELWHSRSWPLAVRVVTVAPLSQQQMNFALWRYIMKLQILYRAPLACLLLFGSYENVLSLFSLSSKIHFFPHFLPISSSTEQNVWVYLPVCSLLCSRVPYHAL